MMNNGFGNRNIAGINKTPGNISGINKTPNNIGGINKMPTIGNRFNGVVTDKQRSNQIMNRDGSNAIRNTNINPGGNFNGN